MAQVIFHRIAVQEHRSAQAWYRERSADAAGRFREAVDRAVARIESDPESHPVTSLSRRFRWVRVRRFPYILVFRSQSPQSVMVVAVAHTSRRPGYWRGRK
ncbi:MAG: type II toxin-antitoxin system RelE/ParE family toxin [Planctomycetales bacterium]|nr:type II toxin-antitoxin system RelE/ParE family toxin [Planctomycetales bacterium]